MKKRFSKLLAVALAMTMCLSLTMAAYADEGMGYDCDNENEMYGVWDYPVEEPMDTPIDGPLEEPYEEIYGYISIHSGDTNITQGESTYAYSSIYTNASSYSIGVTWESSNTSVAQVSGSGNDVTIQGVGAGYATIIAVLLIEGDKYDMDSFELQVRPKQPEHIGVTGISVDYNNINLNVGDTTRVGYTVYPSNASNKSINCFSNNSDVVRVDNDGNMRALRAGNATITYITNDNGYKATCNVTVNGGSTRNVPVTAISVNPSTATMSIGQELYLTPSCYPEDAQNKAVEYFSSNTAVATVTYTGKVVAVGSGTAIITTVAKNGGAQVGTVINVLNAYYVTPSKKASSPVVASATRNADFNFQVLQKIIACPKNGTVNLNPPTPMSFHTTAAELLKTRPDVKVVCTFPFNGVKFKMTVPKGYDLAATMDKTGYVEWLQLCFKPGIIVEAVK